MTANIYIFPFLLRYDRQLLCLIFRNTNLAILLNFAGKVA
uniref:Uncharacterized protein n=1 Tax=Anguilla anguilla TaxID=7936 RepID=A0A0E9WHC4_ANGAN